MIKIKEISHYTMILIFLVLILILTLLPSLLQSFNIWNISIPTQKVYNFFVFTIVVIFTFFGEKLIKNLIIPKELKFCALSVWFSWLIPLLPLLFQLLELKVYIPIDIQIFFTTFFAIFGLYLCYKSYYALKTSEKSKK